MPDSQKSARKTQQHRIRVGNEVDVFSCANRKHHFKIPLPFVYERFVDCDCWVDAAKLYTHCVFFFGSSDQASNGAQCVFVPEYGSAAKGHPHDDETTAFSDHK